MISPRRKVTAIGPEIVCLCLFILYVTTAVPSLCWRDGPEFAVTAQTLGIAHPAGFPTYSLTAKLLTFLPLGGIPFRVTLCSAFWAVAALYVLAALVRRVAAPAGAKVAEWAASGTALVFGLAPTLWINATEAEVYTLHLFFLALIFYCLVRWSEDESEAWLYAGGLMYGLASGNHGTMGFFLPGFLAYFILHSKQRTGQRFFLLVFFFLAGFSVYLYLPVRSAANPAFDWGNPETWSQFLWHITDRKDASVHFAAAGEGPRFFDYLWVFLSRTTPPVFWLIGLPLVLVGAWRLVRTNAPLVAALGYVSLFNVFFFIKWTNPTGFLPAYFCAFLAGGVGAAWFLGRIGLSAGTGGRSRGMALALIMAVCFIGGVMLQYPARDRSKTFLGLESFRADYETLPPDALCLSAILWFHHRAYQDIFRLREDVSVLGLSDFFKPKSFNFVTTGRFPRVAVPPGSYTKADGVDYLKRFIAANLDQKQEIFWEPGSINKTFYANLEPAREILFRFTQQPVAALSRDKVQAGFDRLRSKISRELGSENLLEETEIDAYYIHLLIYYSDYFRLHKRPGDALAMLKFIEEFFGPGGKDTILLRDNSVLSNDIGVCFLLLGRKKEAEDRFRAVTLRDPGYYDAWANLGFVYLKSGRADKALTTLKKAVAVGPDFPEALFNLGEYYRLAGDLDQARDYYRRALTVGKDSLISGQIKKRLRNMAKEAKEAS